LVFREIGFAWGLAATFVGVALSVVSVWQLLIWLPRLAPNMALRLGLLRRRRDQVQQAFFARCNQLLETLKVQRLESETFDEFHQRVISAVNEQSPQATELDDALRVLTAWYHRIRFGNTQPTSLDRDQIERSLSRVEQLVRAIRTAN
jgi:hypothetical protein